MSYNRDDWIKLAKEPIPLALCLFGMVAAIIAGFVIGGWLGR